MKKNLKLLVICLCVGLFACACSSNEETSNSGANNTGTGTSSNSNSTNLSIEEIESNIEYSAATTKRGKLVVFATNKNSIAIDMEIEVEFYDEDGIIAGSDSDTIYGVGAGSEIAVEMYSTPDSYATYKIYIDADTTDVKSYIDQVELTHNDNGEEIVAQVTNNSSDEIDYITVAVVYYRNNEVVGYDYSIELEIKSGRSANFTLYYPYDNNYRDVDFDTYKVFVTEAYSYNW